jgi:hypothetical protein
VALDLTNVDSEDLRQWAEEAAHQATLLGADLNLSAPLWSRRVTWLAVYATTFDRRLAARAAGVAMGSASEWLQDPVFAALVDRANEQVSATVSGEVYRRAVHGTSRGVWHQGQLVGTEQHYSDTLLTTLAKRVDPAWAGETATRDSSQARLVAAVLADPLALEAAQQLADRLAQLTPSRTIEARQPETPGD